MYAARRFSCPSFFPPSTKRRMYKLLSNGLIGAPCGVPRPSSRLRVLRCLFPFSSLTADSIAQVRLALAEAETIPSIRQLESQAAYAYWSAWRNVPVAFPKNDRRRVPEHWRSFGSRHSPLTGSPRLAVNPLNAILNYLYALLESEARLALAALGLDPGIGVMHVDSPARDSLACDLLGFVRPQVDAYLLDWIV